ncbi:HNH endonuclease [Candidatus Poriferisodalis sp.]|uniref:HNH endonuclease signature motif containing protein n=1 Tax=Candidatus Poriferisodalis sp. TaxID=3101277 RepID=UPI003B5AA5F9
MFSQVRQALDSLNAALDSVDAASTVELRRALGLAKQLRSRAELLETKAASQVACRERHGDGGAGLLSRLGGLSRSEAARNVRTDAELAGIPAARAGVAEGEISLANAARLARAARSTSPQAVQDDAELVGLAKSLPADEFAQAAQRWTIRRQSGDGLAVRHRRSRAKRHVRFWNGEDGSVQMRGSFDVEMGARIQARLRHQAEQLRQADRRRTRANQPHNTPDNENCSTAGNENGGTAGGVNGDAVRTRDQRMADALDQALTAADAAIAPRPVEAGSAQQAADALALPGTTEAQRDSDPDPATVQTPSAQTPSAQAPQRAGAAQIIVRADLDIVLGKPGGIAEIAGVGPIPAGTLERLICNSDLHVVFFGDKLTPLYETTPARAPTAAQRRALIARDGACIGCGTPPGECEAHHILPWKCGGKTRVDNLVLVCWSCHVRIHDHNWQVVVRDGRFGLVPPDTAHRENPAPSPKPKHAKRRGAAPSSTLPSSTLPSSTLPSSTLPSSTLPLSTLPPGAGLTGVGAKDTAAESTTAKGAGAKGSVTKGTAANGTAAAKPQATPVG